MVSRKEVFVRRMRKVKGLGVFMAFVFLMGVGGCVSGPSSYYRSETMRARSKAAVIPFLNLTQERDADRKVTYCFITHLLKTHTFDLVEMGETERALRDAKAEAQGALSLEKIKQIGQNLGVESLFLGVVEEFKIDSGTLMGERIFVPEVAVAIRMVSTKDGSIVWSANHHRRGDDRVTVFGMGRVDSISKLMEVIIRDTVKSIPSDSSIQPPAPAFVVPPSEKETPPAPVKKDEDKELRAEIARLNADNESLKKEIENLKKAMVKEEKPPAPIPVASVKDFKAKIGPEKGVTLPVQEAAVLAAAKEAVWTPDKKTGKSETVERFKQVTADKEALGVGKTDALKEAYRAEYQKIKEQYSPPIEAVKKV